jgi:hypothetical protein
MSRGLLRLAALAAALAGAALPTRAQPILTPKITPSPVVLGEASTIQIKVKGLAGPGELHSDVNVGTVERIEEQGGEVLVNVNPPERGSPQILCLALWRGTGVGAKVHIIRVPMLGRTAVPIRTRKHATVRVLIGTREFGPVVSGSRGRVRIPVVVPPEAKQATVEVTGSRGLKSRRSIRIEPAAYNQLALAIVPAASGSSDPRLRITVATAEGGTPRVRIGDGELVLARQPGGTWSGIWSSRQAPRGRIPIRAWLPGRPSSVRLAEVGISSSKLTVNVIRVKALTKRSPGRLRGDLGLLVGMVHNLGDMASPRLGVDLGLDYPLPVGRIGVRLFASFSWASQQIPGSSGLADGESSIALVPIGAGITYRLPLPLRPYVMVGLMAQIVRFSNTAEFTQERLKHEVAPGFLGLIGAEYRLGPGRALLQVGYQWSRVENLDLTLQAGGLVLEGGYRLDL